MQNGHASPPWVERLERLEHAAARRLVGLSSRAPAWLLSRSARVIDGVRLHPEMQLLLALRALNDRYGHLQELIIQNFRAKPDTPMAHAADAGLELQQWTLAAARLLAGHAPESSIERS